VELEKLNKASENINRLELELEKARLLFKHVLSDSTQQLEVLAKKLGSCIEKSRPYYDARFKLKEAQGATQNAALRYERACSQLAAAKEMVNLAEQGYFNHGQPFDPAWQEMLNHSTMKVNDSERERLESEIEHMNTAQMLNDAEQLVRKLQRDWKRNIAKSRPYFELKAKITQQMEDQKKKIGELEERVSKAKSLYSQTLKRLEEISDDIHAQRRRRRQEKKKRAKAAAAAAASKEPVIYHPLMDVEPSSSSPDDDGDVDTSDDEKPAARPTTPLNGGMATTIIARRENKTCSPQHLPTGLDQNQISRPGSTVVDPLQTTTLVHSEKLLPASNSKMQRNGSAMTDSNRPSIQRAVSLADSVLSPISPDADLDHVQANAAVMAAVSRSKQQRISSPFLRPNSSRDDFLTVDGSETDSVSGSFVSGCGGSALDDEQIESLMMDMGAYGRFVAEMDSNESEHLRQMELPARLRHLRDFVTFEPIWVDDDDSRSGLRRSFDEGDSRDLDTSGWDASHVNNGGNQPTGGGVLDKKCCEKVHVESTDVFLPRAADGFVDVEPSSSDVKRK
jgi:hypothetical protein